jgi:hypothetical protein
MINLTLGSTDNVYLTLTEKATLASPNYLFRFVQRTTNREVRFVKTNGDDLSAYPERYNQFAFDVDQLFCGEVGEYHYFIYEQASASNTELENTGAVLETGMMRLSEAVEDRYAFEAYQTDNEYITR